MGFKGQLNKDFIIENNHIKLTNEYINKNSSRFKKITGSRIASILGQNKYSSPVKTWAMMTNIYFEEMDPTLSEVGNIIEPKIKQYVEEQTQFKFKQYIPSQIKWDVFKDNKVFGGIPDGEPIDASGKLLYEDDFPMLEIKTTSVDSFVYKKIDGTLRMQKDASNLPIIKQKNQKKESWYVNGVIEIPEEYKLQLSLYLYLRNAKKGLFAIAFLEQKDYASPNEFDPDNRTIELVELNLDKSKFIDVINLSTDWYNNHILKGISPALTEEDKKWLIENNIL